MRASSSSMRLVDTWILDLRFELIGIETSAAFNAAFALQLLNDSVVGKKQILSRPIV